MLTILGWFNAEAALASCTNRLWRSGSATRSGGKTLIATGRSRCVSRALYTRGIRTPAGIGESLRLGGSDLLFERSDCAASAQLRPGGEIFNPLHYLALLEQKTNALDQAAPLEGLR